MSGSSGWDEALVAAGFVDRRSGKGPSWSALAQAIGTHTSTLTAMRDGERSTDQATVDKVSKALHLDPRTVAKWIGRTRSERDPYTPPAEANLLDRDEREAIDRMIELLARSKMIGGSSDDRQSEAQKSPHLHADDQDRVTLAARRIHGPKGIIDPSQETAGEENQDPGGWEGA